MSVAVPNRESLTAALGLVTGRELLEDEGLCLNVRGRGEHCDRCARACHVGALTLSPDTLEVERATCTGCGGCVPACPAGALRLRGFSPIRFLAALGGEAQVHLHCSASRDAGGGVVIACFKLLDERLLAAARADGVEALILHGLNRCPDCRHGGAVRQVARIARRLAHLLGESAPDLRPAAASDAAPRAQRQYQDQPHLSRRTFLRFAGAQVSLETARWLVPVEDEDDGQDLPFFQGDPDGIRRPHPYQALLAARVDRVPWRPDRKLPWRLRKLDGQCTACLVCGKRCPTGALSAHDDGRTALSISYEPALCTDCGLCGALCPVRAVEIRPAHLTQEVSAPRTTLMLRRLRPCDLCGTTFAPDTVDATACPICANEQALDDEWLAILEG
jgi:ferredoxin